MVQGMEFESKEFSFLFIFFFFFIFSEAFTDKRSESQFDQWRRFNCITSSNNDFILN